jgi:hypothetical protein
MWNFLNKGPRDPHAGRRVALGVSAGQSGADAVKKAIWTLIVNNCDPPRRFDSGRSMSGQQDTTPISDVTVQTFYVVYSPSQFDQFAMLDAERIAEEVIRDMIGNRLAVYEPYLRNKVGAVVWEQATIDDAAAGGHEHRVDAARIVRLVEVLRCPLEHETEPCVVGRESLAVETARLRAQGKDPSVIAQIFVSGSANVNPHTREAQANRSAGRGDTICVLEGRAASVFFIGSNIYDDVQVEGMPPGEWYQLLVLAPDQLPVNLRLLDSSGKPLDQPQGRPPITWRLGPPDGGDWSCLLQATMYRNLKVSQVMGLPEIPPSIRIAGRILPKGFPPPDALQSYLRGRGLTCETAVRLEDNLYLYVPAPGDEVHIVDLDGNKGLSVDPPRPVATNAHALDDLSSVTIGRVSYVWRTDGLPIEVVGRLEYKSQSDCPSEAMPVDEDSVNDWVIGRQHRVGARMHGTPVFMNNPDPYLSSNGNLIISYSGKSADERPAFKLTLLSERELPLFVWPYSASQWQKVAWPSTHSGAKKFEVPQVQLIGVSNKLIFGTSYYNVATSHTL